MQLKTLATTPLPQIVDCLNKAFAGYFVPLPEEVAFWEAKFQRGRVDYSLSFGAFDQDQLVGFIINGIDQRNSKYTAFNSGTGVLPTHRGEQLVDQLYGFSLPLLKAKGIEHCELEVIQQNDRAIRVYERIGFQKKRLLHCFGGKYTGPKHAVQIKQIPFTELRKRIGEDDAIHAWDHNHQAVAKGGAFFETYQVTDTAGEYIGYFVINAGHKFLAQFDCATKDIEKLFSGVAQLTETCRMNNIDEKRKDLVQGLQELGFKNTINQYEMEWGMG